MKSSVRGWIVSFFLFFLRGTFLAEPFRRFEEACRSIFGLSAGWIGLREPWSDILQLLLLTGLVSLLLHVSKGKYAEYVAGVCAIASLLYQLLKNIETGDFHATTYTAVLGVVLALVFFFFRMTKTSLWLADMYIFVIPVWFFVDLVLAPTVSLLPGIASPFRNFFDIPVIGTADRIHYHFFVPAMILGLIFFALLCIPIFILAKKRKKG